MKRILSLFCTALLLLAFALPTAAYALSYEEGANATGGMYMAPEATYIPPVRTFNLRRTAAGPVANADFIFVIDSTGSMRSYINSVRTNLKAFSLYLQAKGIDVRFSVIDFKDITSDGANSTVLHKFGNSEWTDDPTAVENTLSRLSVTGGGDEPETPTNALMKIFDGYTHPFRDDASCFVFLLTDAAAKDSSDHPSVYDIERLAADLQRGSVYTSVVSKRAYKDHYDLLYNQTGGIFIDIDHRNYYELMLEVADWIIESTVDTDKDGLPDVWETEGVDCDNDGTIDLNLPAMGADPNVPDIFIELDWMHRDAYTSNIGPIKINHPAIDLRPSPEALRIVIDQFADADHDIQLHIDAGPDSIMNPRTGATWGNLSRSTSIPYQSNLNLGDNYENWDRMAVQNFDRDRWTVFRYCLSINNYNNSNSSGLSWMPGQYFIIADTREGKSSGIMADDTKAAGTFMHELGHTLSLDHGGNESTNYKPNYLSIMNYSFQLSGLIGTNEVNYSEYILPAINENSVNENRGVDPNRVTAGSGLGTKWYYDGLFRSEGSKENIAGIAINFNNNLKLEENVSINLNKDSETNLGASINDWEHLQFKAGAIGGLGASLEEDPVLIYKDASDPIPDSLSLDEAEALGLLGNPGDSRISAIAPTTLYTAVEDQTIDITVQNESFEATTAQLSVTSSLLPENYSATIALAASEKKTLRLPVSDSLAAGDYTLRCELISENDEVQSIEMIVPVFATESLNLGVGQSFSVRNSIEEECRPVSNDPSIVKVDGDKLVGVQVGSTTVTLLDSDGNTICTIPVNVLVLPTTGDPSTPGLWLLMSFFGLVLLSFASKKAIVR